MMKQGYKVIQASPASYTVEGFFRKGPSQRFRSVNGSKTAAEARQWVYDQQAKDAAAVTPTPPIPAAPPL
jgi:hypothetical protein